ncbi:MAG: hypothetical protein ACRC2N_02140 [Aeromonas sp.]
MKTIKSAIAMGIIASAMISGAASAMPIEATGSAEMHVTATAPKFCSILVTDAEAGISTNHGIQTGNFNKNGRIVLQSSFPASFTFDVSEQWTKLEPWGGEMPEIWNHALSREDGPFDEFTAIHSQGNNTNAKIEVMPNKNPEFNAYRMYSFTSDFWQAGEAEATVTITAHCSEII